MNIRGKKIWITALMTIGIVILLVFTYQYHINAPLKGLKIQLNDEEVYSFLQKEDIERLFIHEKNVQVEQLTIKTANLEQLEKLVLTHPWIASANMFIDNGRYLNIQVTQRIPIARIFDQKNLSYYLDKDGYTMPVVVGYSYPAVVFTNVENTTDTNKQRAVMKDIITLAKFIDEDTFWSKQIVQVDVKNNNKYELATLLGNQKVVLGTTEHLDVKFSNLLVFYQQVSNPLGWDKYTEINISFLNQVVASPSLGWVPPQSTDTLIALPEELKDNELIQTLPERPMEEAKGILKDEKEQRRPIVVPITKPDTTKTEKDSTKIA